MRLWIIGLWLALAALAVSAASRQLEGEVTRVVDGDSVWLAPAGGGAPVELRLVGIDAPEICQPWGPQARDALAEQVLGRQVRVKTVGRDTFERTLGTLFVDGRNVNQWLVQEGHAWSARYRYDRGPYVREERMAKALSRGFNRAGGAVLPRDFRREHGPCFAAGDGSAGARNGAAGRAAAAGAGGAGASPEARATAGGATNGSAAPQHLPGAAASYRCDGRTRCSQMSSCDEATWFLRNCPGVQMDGNGDGVPCERQWCRP